MKIGYCNADGLRSNLPTVNQFINDNKLHIMAIAESWLNDTVNINLHNYRLVRNDRGLINLDTGRDTRGGGVAFFIHTSLHSTIIARSRVKIIGEIEFLILRITDPVTRFHVLVGCVYRPPRGKTLDEFFEILDINRL